MSYRINERPRKPKTRQAQALTTPSDIFVVNGTTTRIAIPCFYHEIRRALPAVLHDRMIHDHIGWPTPDSPDHVCQPHDFAIPPGHPSRAMPHMGYAGPGEVKRYIDMSKVFPVHLTKEGYNKYYAKLAASISSYASATVKVDPEKDWVIRVTIKANKKFDEIDDKQAEQVGAYSIFASHPDGFVQCVTAGRLHIMPALWDTNWS